MIMDKVRNALRSFLRIEPAQSTTVTITERLDFNTNAAKNRIWYRGNGQELSELYRQISSDKTSFWSAVPTYGMEIRKVHTGIPRLMVDVLTSVVLADMNDIKLPENLTDIWNEIAQDEIVRILILLISEISRTKSKNPKSRSRRRKKRKKKLPKQKLKKMR